MSPKKQNRTGARRQQRSKGRKDMLSSLSLLLVFFKSVLATTILVAVFVVSARWYQTLQQPDARPFAKVEIDGEFTNLNKSLFTQKVINSIDRGYFALDLEMFKQTLEQDPWVYRIDLQRFWPDTLLVQVEEQVPIAFWGEGGYLNQYGEQFELRGERVPQQLPFLIGSAGREKILIEDFLAYDNLLGDIDLELVQLSEDARLDQRLMLANGTVIALGREYRRDRVKRLTGIYRNQLGDVANRIAALDLRYKHGFSVRWKNSDTDIADLDKPDAKAGQG